MLLHGPFMLLQLALFHSLFLWLILSTTYLLHLINSSVNGHLGCFKYKSCLTIVNSASMNIIGLKRSEINTKTAKNVHTL